jgi:hypothetical protein
MSLPRYAAFFTPSPSLLHSSCLNFRRPSLTGAPSNFGIRSLCVASTKEETTSARERIMFKYSARDSV